MILIFTLNLCNQLSFTCNLAFVFVLKANNDHELNCNFFFTKSSPFDKT